MPRGPSKKHNTVTIYVLIDPRDGEIRYVGQSNYVEWRYSLHLQPSALTGHTPKELWIVELRSLGLRPIVESLMELPGTADYNRAEMMWIRLLTLAGCRLTNSDSLGKVVMEQARKERRQAGLVTKEDRERDKAIKRILKGQR